MGDGGVSQPRERPILFSGPMVRAILSGAKTQTRRVVKEPKVATLHGRQSLPPRRHYADRGFGDGGYLHWGYGGGDFAGDEVFTRVYSPYGNIGDRLWVRETWADVNTENGPAVLFRADNHYRFCCDDAYPVEYDRYPGCQFTMWCGDLLRGELDHKWRPSIHMPRFASRITLEVTDVRAERLQEITNDDAKREGVEQQCLDGMGCWVNYQLGDGTYCLEARSSFETLWDSIDGKRPGCSWEANPWVWVVGFKRLNSSAERALGDG